MNPNVIERARELVEMAKGDGKMSSGHDAYVMRYARNHAPDIANVLIQCVEFIQRIADNDVCERCEDQIRARVFFERLGVNE